MQYRSRLASLINKTVYEPRPHTRTHAHTHSPLPLTTLHSPLQSTGQQNKAIPIQIPIPGWQIAQIHEIVFGS